MAEKKAEKPISAKALDASLPAKYAKIDLRTERLDRLCDFLPPAPDPLDTGPEDALGYDRWQGFDTRKKNMAVGFVRQGGLLDRHLLHRPLEYVPRAEVDWLEKAHVQAAANPKIVFRYKDHPIAALSPAGTLATGNLLSLVPRMKTTPTEDIPVVLNSRLAHYVWQYEHGKSTAKGTPTAIERLAGFRFPMLTKKVGGPFREVRDEILARAEKNADRLAEMDRVERLAGQAGVKLVPLRQSEGIIREINVPRPLGPVAQVRRRGPVVIFKRGSTIVTTTEEAATYLELWLHQRFDQLEGMTRDHLEEFVQIPTRTSQVVVVLQRRARIETEIDAEQDEVEELQATAEDHLYDLYGITDEERVGLRAHYS